MSQGDQQYLAILDELRELHVRKAMDYGSDEDPLANLRGSDDIGIAPWMGVWLRTLDKVRRMNRYCRKGQLANEGVEDTLLDMAAYACLALRLFRETLPKSAPALADTQALPAINFLRDGLPKEKPAPAI
jgi:hypothetical protein